MKTKSYIIHNYSSSGDYIDHLVFDSRKDLAEYLSKRDFAYDKNKLSDLGSDLMVIHSKDGSGYVEIEELADSSTINVDGKEFVSIDEYCHSHGVSKKDLTCAIKDGKIHCFKDLGCNINYVDPDCDIR